MKKDVFITLRVERTLKELLVSEARKKKQSLSKLLRDSILDKYKPDKPEKKSKQGGLR